MRADKPGAIPVPPEVEAYVRAIGADATATLLLEFGGAPLYFADRPGSKSKVAALISAPAARALARELGRGHLRVPTAKRWLAQHLKKNGWSVAAIARRLHVTDVTVRSYLRPSRGDRQLSLFGGVNE